MCEICRRIDLIKGGENPYFVRELETGYVVIADTQRIEGYTIFLCKEHVTELFHLEHGFMVRHLEEMALVSQAVHAAFGAEKMNCELLGNGDAHVHWHLFPRKTGDTAQSGPVWWIPKEELYSEEFAPSEEKLTDYKFRLNRALEELL